MSEEEREPGAPSESGRGETVGGGDHRTQLARALGAGRDPALELPGDPEDSVERAARERLEKLRAQEAPAQRYLLMDEVGRGGMGAVLRVYDTDLRRNLAMKLVRAPSDERAEADAARQEKLVARFLEEAQLTAQLDHPGVVPVHELGVDEERRVYFTMRLVRGEDLSRVLARVRAGEPEWTRTRVLGVLLKVCDAMAYAHEKGVVHRDLKPANVMVGRHGAVYVMDWGVARVAGREDTRDLRPRADDATLADIRTDRGDSKSLQHDSPLLTMDGDVLGTPYYMPPEQAAGRLEDLGPPSDVYALGAILYELLAGQAPYRPPGERVSAHTILARVLDGPPAPLASLAPDVPPELVAICEKAMARDRSARYPDMSALAADLRAFLEDRVVKAYGSGALLELRKWVRRNRALAAMALALLTLSVGGSTTAALVLRAKNQEVRGARDEALLAQQEAEASAAREAGLRALAEESERRARGAEALAEARAAELAQVADFQAGQLAAFDVEGMGARLRRSLLDVGPPERREERERALEGLNFTSLALRALDESLFTRTIAAIDAQFADQPLVRAQLLQTVATTLRDLGLFDAAGDPQARALALRREALGREHERSLESVAEMGALLQAQGRFAEAELYLGEALEARRRLLGEEHPDTLASLDALGYLRLKQGRLNEAETLYRAALDGRRRALGEEHPDTLASLNGMGGLLHGQGRLEEAEPFYRAALEGRRRALGEDDPQTLLTQNNLGGLLLARREMEEAERSFRAAYEGTRRVLGDEHPSTLAAMDNLGEVLNAGGRAAEAEPLCRATLEARRRVLGPAHPDTLVSLHNLAYLLHARGELDAALPLYREALAGQRRQLGDAHDSTQWTRGNLWRLLEERAQRESSAKGAEHRDALAARRELAALGASFDAGAESEAALRALLDARIGALGVEDPDTLESFRDLAALLARADQLEEAEALLQEARGVAREAHGEASPPALAALEALTALLADQARWSEARALARTLVELTPPDAPERDARAELLRRVERESDD